MDDRVELGVEPLRAFDRALRELLGAHLPASHQLSLRGRVQPCQVLSHSSSSSPTTKRSGRSVTLRTASRTPGMKLERSTESWRIESVWLSPPKMTSWCATSPGSRTEWIGSWTFPPAPRINSAVRLAVPEGAPFFWS